ncbi:MAG: GTPase HflX [Spirochaetes bacterium]|nr:MAG: GTPase HflX [Spirochaetota bacterium]
MDASVNRIPSSAEERACLVAIRLGKQDSHEVEHSLDELRDLVRTAGAIIVDTRVIRRDRLDASSLVGKGTLEKLKAAVEAAGIKLLVFDLNLIKPAQIRNMEEILKIRVVGRTEIILDIFARRARSAESKIQVELAQLRYILPRLKGLGGVLSRLGGGIGTRGPGEKMLETDRRHVLRRISVLKSRLETIAAHRARVRKSRADSVCGAVVGYTNAGKSTLINFLARDDLFVEDRLFATLDAYTRSVHIADDMKALLTDTVGFITNLPTNLIESFKSTLEEINNADFLIHVADITAPTLDKNIRVVEDELAHLGSGEKQCVLFLNKADRFADHERALHIAERFPGCIVGSAVTGEGIPELRTRLASLYECFSVFRVKKSPPRSDD